YCVRGPLVKTALAVLPAPAEQQRGGNIMAPCRCRRLTLPPQALLDDARLLHHAPPPPAAAVHHRQPSDKDTVTITSHSDRKVTGRLHPVEHLASFNGILQADAYAG